MESSELLYVALSACRKQTTGLNLIRTNLSPLSSHVTRVFLTGKEKKPEVSEKRVYRISRKIIGFAILISDEI